MLRNTQNTASLVNQPYKTDKQNLHLISALIQMKS